MLVGTGVFVLAIAIFLALRVSSFVGETTGGGRTESYLATPTANLLATSTAQSKVEQLFGTATPGSASPATATPAPTVNYNNSSIVQKIKNNEPITTLLLGYGGNGHEGEWLTDTLLVMRYDPKTRTMLQYNIPRDLYVFIPFGGKDKGRWGKINTALAIIMKWDNPSQSELNPKYRWTDEKKQFDNGVNLVADTIEIMLGFRVDNWATLSFDGFRRFIDAMGGVEVDVEHYFIDKKYPRNDNDQVDASFTTIEFQAGKQIMNGERAIEYARSRYSQTPLEGGDFARSRRQMRLIAAVKEKMLRENLAVKSLGYMQALQGKIRFSLDFGEVTALANYLNSSEGKSLANDVKFSSEILNDTYLEDKTLEGDYVLLPKEGKGKYAAIQSWAQKSLANADIRREMARVQVLNASVTAGLAAKFTDFLIDQGFRVAEEDNTDTQNQTELLDYSNNSAPNTIARLKNWLPNLKVTQVPPNKRPKDLAPEITMQLLLGKDFKNPASAEKR